MAVSDKLSKGFAQIVSRAGRQIKVDYYTQVYDGVYDEPGRLLLSGTVWTSGVILSLSDRNGTTDSILLQQGKLQQMDKKLYVNGSLDFTEVDKVVKVQIGSPTGDVYSTIPDGSKMQEVNGVPIYKLQYIRHLQTGDF